MEKIVFVGQDGKLETGEQLSEMIDKVKEKINEKKEKEDDSTRPTE